MIDSIRHVLAVPNLEQSAAYYRDVLGFTIHRIEDPGWRFFIKDNCFIMAGECPDAMPPKDLGDHSYFAYWVVRDVDDYFRFVSERGAEILKPLRNEIWGMREFALRTPDGHRIMVAQPVA